MEFKQQYKHPLWQKKRIEALDVAGYACQCCGDEETQLHVHHRQYFKGRLIWEYGTDELEVLCEVCHMEAHAKLDQFKAILATLPLDGLGEVAALVAGYRATVLGPAMSDANNPAYSTLYRAEPHAFKCGEVAAAAAALSVVTIDELRQEIVINSRGGRIDVAVPARKVFVDGAE